MHYLAVSALIRSTVPTPVCSSRAMRRMPFFSASPALMASTCRRCHPRSTGPKQAREGRRLSKHAFIHTGFIDQLAHRGGISTTCLLRGTQCYGNWLSSPLCGGAGTPVDAMARGGGHGGGHGGWHGGHAGHWSGHGAHWGGHSHGRYWHGGRWWSGYGVGPCWRSTPAGWIWICN